MITHKLYTEYNEEAGSAYWSCSCGRGGTAAIETVDIVSDRHIGPDESRVDTSREP